VYHKLSRPVGVWEWGLLYKEARWVPDGGPANTCSRTQQQPDQGLRGMAAPWPSPLHAGGLIAVLK
jgi:hypothetical protein